MPHEDWMPCVSIPRYKQSFYNLLSLYWSWIVSWYLNCRFIARPCAMGLKIQANGPQKAQPNAILEKVFTAITKVVHVLLCYCWCCVSSQMICTTSNIVSVCLVLPAPGWKEAGGLVQAARLGCANHPALVPTTAQPGETQHSRPILWKHVSFEHHKINLTLLQAIVSTCNSAHVSCINFKL